MTNKLILNPEYTLVEDNDRVLIIKSNNGRYTDSQPSFIHPLLAKFLALFDGTEDKIRDTESQYGIEHNDFEGLAKMFANNKSMYIKYAGETFYIPKNILIPNENSLVRTDLKDDYQCTEPYDFKRLRLSYPKSIVYVVNMKCYTDCIYCYANRKYVHNIMSTDKIVNIINEAKSVGILGFMISGGEFFLQKDWDVILRAFHANSYDPQISTKVPLSENDILIAKNIGLTTIQFSLDTLREDIAKKTLRVKGDYIDKITKSIKFADSLGLKIVIKPTLSKDTCTVENLTEILDFAATLKNVEKVTVSTVGKSIYLSEDRWTDIRPTLKQVADVEKFIKHSNCNFYIKPDSNTIRKEELCDDTSFKERSLCTANINGFILLPDGKVTICEELYWSDYFLLGDVNTHSILDVWRSAKAAKLWNITNGDFPTNSACKNCDDLKSCRHGRGVCWKMAMQAYGRENFLFPNPRCPRAPESILNIIDI